MSELDHVTTLKRFWILTCERWECKTEYINQYKIVFYDIVLVMSIIINIVQFTEFSGNRRYQSVLAW